MAAGIKKVGLLAFDDDVFGTGGAAKEDFSNLADVKESRANVGIVTVNLVDYITNPAIRSATLANTNLTQGLSDYWDAAYAALPPQGGKVIVPNVTMPMQRNVVLGNGTAVAISNRNGIVIEAEGARGVDDGTFGGGQPNSGARFLYIGPQDDTLYFFKVMGPAWGMGCVGVHWDCNAKAGYPFFIANSIEGRFEMIGTRYRTGQGKIKTYDAALPFGVTLGTFKNKFRIKTSRPSWDGAATKRGLQGFLYEGAPTFEQGTSLNEFDCEHVFDDAGTFAMKDTFIDNNWGNFYLRTSTGTSPVVDPTLAGVGRIRVIPSGAVPIGENRFAGNFGGGAFAVNEGGTTIYTGEPDWYGCWPLNDYEPVPIGRNAKGWTAKGQAFGGVTGSLNIDRFRSTGNLAATSPYYYTPIGIGVGGGDRFVEQNGPARDCEVWTFSINLGASPGVGNTRTFTLLQNGIATAATVTYGAAESGMKEIAMTTPISCPKASEWVISSTFTGTPTGAPMFGAIGSAPKEAI